MYTQSKQICQLLLGLTLIALLAACGAPIQPTSTPTATETPTVLPSPFATHTASPTPAPSPTVSPTPTPRILNLCLGSEPDSLYIYGSSMYTTLNILAAIYDGPIDTNGFAYQPVILEKLPSLADGDAVLQPVSVQENDRIVNDAGEVVLLKPGEIVRPFGCNLPSCAVPWYGSPLEMAQLSSTFSLLEGLRWSDGEPLTARDSVFSYHIAASPDTPIDKYTIQRTASYTALDDITVQWVGLPGFMDAKYQINFFHPLPKHQLGGYSAAELLDLEETQEHPLGWGPYVIQEWEFGKEIRFTRNPYYFRPVVGRFAGLTIRFWGGDSDVNLAAIQNGKCDLIDYDGSSKAWDDELQNLLDLEAAGQVDVQFATGTTWEHLDFNLRSLADDGFAALDADGDGAGPFGDVRLRQAIAMCLDRQAVVDAVFLGQTLLPSTYLSPQHPLYAVNANTWSYDPTAAGILLDEIGWLDHDANPITPRQAENVLGVPDGTPLEFSLETTTATLRQQLTQILADNLALCGIKVNLAYYPAAEFFADAPEGKLLARRFEGAVFAWLTGVRPPCELYLSDQIPGPPDQINPATGQNYLGWGVQNETGYASAEYDAACTAARFALPGTIEYAQNHLLAQEIFAHDIPAIPLFLRIKFTVSRPDFCGHTMNPTAGSDFWNIENYDYGAACP